MNYKELRVLLLKRFSIQKEQTVKKTLRSLTIAEKAVFFFFASVFIISGIILLWQVNNAFLVEVPTNGGTLTEGVVGNPRFINPVLAISEADKNLTALIYSGLVYITPNNKIENDLIDKLTISDDRLIYTDHIHENARFHDGTPVTADDVIFTIQKITNPIIKSPKRGNWDGVTVEKIDENTVSFTLKQAYTPFINSLVFKFYPSEDLLIEAYVKHEIESLSGISSEKILEIKSNNSTILSSPLPRVFAVFFNQNKSEVLLNKEVRKALDLASPKEEIVENILGGFGVAIDNPLPAGIYDWADRKVSTSSQERLELAKELLAKAGWKANEETGILEKKSGKGTITMSFSISTGDAPELQVVAGELASAWSKLGAKVDILVFETGDLNQNIIRPRNFDALLFGEVIGRNADLYPFWHSSQRTDPGLNIALYANSRADTFLNNARSAKDFEVIEENYKDFVEELQTDIPAVFLYTPNFLYVVPKKVEAINLDSLTISQDRFLGIRDWYIETDKIWKIFIN